MKYKLDGMIWALPGAYMFSGVKDADGNEIYEGDMLEWDEDYDKDCCPDDADTYKKRGIVTFKNGLFSYNEDSPHDLVWNVDGRSWWISWWV